MDSTLGITAMSPRSRASNRSKKENVKNPRKHSGNTIAVGSYLAELRRLWQQQNADYSRERMVDRIREEMAGNVTMSMSTLIHIEDGSNKSVSAASIAAVRRAVQGDPWDIEELWRFPLPADENDELGIKASRDEGQRLAFQQWARIQGRGAESVIAANTDSQLVEILRGVATDKELQEVVKQLEDDPTAREFVLAMLRGRKP